MGNFYLNLTKFIELQEQINTARHTDVEMLSKKVIELVNRINKLEEAINANKNI